MARDDTKLAFSSAYRYPRLFMEGKELGASGTVTITHNLGYRPFVKVAAEYSDGSFGNVSNAGETPYGNANVNMSIFITIGENDLEILAFDNTISGDTVDLYYRIYEETL